MASKKTKKVLITSIATVVGIFGGMKLYTSKKRKDEDKVIKTIHSQINEEE